MLDKTVKDDKLIRYNSFSLHRTTVVSLLIKTFFDSFFLLIDKSYRIDTASDNLNQ